MVLGDISEGIQMDHVPFSLGYGPEYLRLMEAAQSVADLIDLTQCDPPL